MDDQGRSQFQLLQNYQKTGAGRLRYYVFDLLYLDGRDLRRLPLKRRKQLLARIVRGLPNVLLSEHVEQRGVDFFRAAVARGLEGIIAKDGNSPYREGMRGPYWLKIKVHHRQEAVIGGFTEPRGSRKDLGALVLGVYEGGALTYIGHTGGGLTAGGLSDLRAELQPLVRPDCPFQAEPRTNAPVHWVTPKLVCEVTFQEWTHDGRMRQPIFVGLREDKDPRDVRREIPGSADGSGDKPSAPRPPGGLRAVNTAASNGSDRRPAQGKRGPQEPPLTHLEKLY